MMPIRLAAAFVAALAIAGPAMGQAFPSKPIRLIVPFPPGGGTDIVSRHVAKQLSESSGWTIVVENKAGAGGTLGLTEAARAAPDGYTVVMGQADNMVVAPALQKNLAINPVKDLTPVMQVAASPFLFMSAAGSKYANLNDVIAEAKAAPGKVSYGSAGSGTFTHLVMELLQQRGGFTMVHVPYKGASPAMADVIGGHIPMAALSIGSGMSGIQGGKLRGLAVTSLKRSPALPDVPTLDELGFKGFEANGWLGILVPNGTPPDVVARLNAELAKAMQSAELRKTLLATGIEARTGTPQEFGALIARDTGTWHKIVETAGIKAE
ncbi:MAG: tripartite tricarboxylate transporter substrate binding protein [Betaproteobacteria bacterium]|jgi:tripartite-type tricarboxylate transporter receptor subunit TctC|nr:tripartite tricarboxylate transporter substrate binding protein [Betaproteobacteria bacterium]